MFIFLYGVFFAHLRKIKVIILFPILFAFFFIAFRTIGVGADDITYLNFFSSNTSSVFSFINNSSFEPGFSFFVYCSQILLEPDDILKIIVIVNLFIMYVAYKKIDDYYFIYFICYLLTSVYWLGFHHIRYGLSLGLFLISISYYYKNNKKWVLYFICSFLFHYAIIIFFGVFFVNKITSKLKWFLLLLFSIIFSSYFSFSSVLEILLQYNLLPVRTSGLLSGQYLDSLSLFQFGFIKAIFLSFIFIVGLDKHHFDYKIKCYIFLTILMILFSSAAIFSNRASALLLIIEPVGILFFLKNNRFFSISDNICCILTIFISFIYGMYLLEFSHVINNYNFIFYRYIQ